MTLGHKTIRRTFLKATAAGLGSLATGGGLSIRAAERAIQLSPEHQKSAGHRRRIVVQYDCQSLFDLDFERWIAYRFGYADEPGTQIDALWWDLGRLGNVFYPSKFLNLAENRGLKKWREQGIDMVGRLVQETKKRNLECFWHHRVSEVDVRGDGLGAAWKGAADPLKQAHPDWTLKCWWRHGLWNFAVPAVRQYTVDSLREVAERYDFDGIQLDFARHVPCLPLGHQWELRHQLTDLVRGVRRMLSEVEKQRGRPFLLAAKVPQNLKGCRIDGFDVEAWASENLIDIFTLGSRSLEVDFAAFRRITAGRDIKLQACFDDHHASDGYRYPPIELLRGVFGNWWQQGADSVCTFNWSNAPPEAQCKVGDDFLPGPLSQGQAYHEVGSPATLRLKDKIFPVERRGGYPWAEGYFNRNDDAPLPASLTGDGQPLAIRLRIGDDLPACADKVQRAMLRAVLFGAGPDEQLELRLNGRVLTMLARDPQWKDAQIFSPHPQPASGGSGHYRINSAQRLLRLDYSVDIATCRAGLNEVELRLAARAGNPPSRGVALEKLELHADYA